MRIPELYASRRPVFSFEFFPPKTDAGYPSLFRTIADLAALEPGFVSVTCGAAGSTRRKTADLVNRIQREIGLTAMAHVTCTGRSAEELAESLERMERAGIENVLALRGDPPKGTTKYEPPVGGFRYANELIEFIHANDYPFCVGSACYPEGHIETPSRDEDLINLKRKVDAGLDFLITQLFFDNAFYFDFVERARRAGINIPIVPGIMPITSFDQLGRFVRLCGATVPMRLQIQLEQVKDEPDAVTALGVAHATVQCLELLQRGVPGIHYYTLNRSPATRMIVGALRARG